MTLKYVKAAPGIKVPKEQNPKGYITEDKIEPVDSVYYDRRLRDGDLLLVTEKEYNAQEAAARKVAEKHAASLATSEGEK